MSSDILTDAYNGIAGTRCTLIIRSKQNYSVVLDSVKRYCY